MTTITTPATGLKARWARFVETRRLLARQRQAYRQTHAELACLTTRELADLGLSRYDIAQVARQAALAVS